ncbi:Helicase associated domain protein [Streptomyces sp. NPDC046465]|uniref:DEAD/DEAH box helicase n=1 Tax=Streptomyces sp. NPDC046465 TaxID=3155810 RepID=UPI0033C7D31C
MAGQTLFPHQVEAVDAVVRVLQVPAGGSMPPEGLRTQVIAATGSGKTLIATAAAQRLGARRVLVLVPTLDLLVQTAEVWRAGGRAGAMVGVCSLRAEDSQGVPCTTDAAELAAWVAGLDAVTVFATYASVGQGTLQRAHAAGLGAWDLMVVDEAHRTSGDGLKPWAAVHDQQRIPAARRLYMTATPRIWEASDQAAGSEDGEGRLVASMSPDSPIFGPVAYRLTLSEAIGRGLVAPYQVVCIDISDPDVHQAYAEGDFGSEAVRGARLAALQTGILSAAAQEERRKLLTFHSRVAEAEAMAAGVPDVAARLWREDPRRFPAPDRVWSAWLCGEHTPGHRRVVLAEFASDVIDDRDQDHGQKQQGGHGQERLRPAALRVLSSVKVLGEGVDTKNCDSVAFCDARGSMVDISQMVGRSLRMQPGEGKISSLMVPVFLAPGESPDEMLTSNAYGTLAKILAALRAHDSETIEALADSRPRSGSSKLAAEDDRGGGEAQDDAEAHGLDDDSGDGLADAEGGVGAGASRPARELLKFSAPRDPAVLARFMKLRVIDPENAFWRRGIEACARYVKESGVQELRVPYDFVTPQDWAPAGFPLGTWLADQRRFAKADTLSASRVEELDGLGMVWSHQDVAFEEGLSAARAWAAVHGHFLPPATAVWNGYPVGSWAKNQRAAAKLADQAEEQRAAGLPVERAGALTQARREALDDIDPGWCPAWDVGWQRAFRLLQEHLRAGGAVPGGAGELVVQGEDLGRWALAQRLGWDQLAPAQVWLLANVLGLDAAGENEQPVKRTQDDKWALNMRAARAFHAREGHLRVPRKHIEHLAASDTANGAQAATDGVPVRLGTWLDNVRKRADKLAAERRADLAALGVPWAAGQ